MSISKPVVIRYRWDRENVEKLFDSSYRYQFTHSVNRYIGWFFIAVLQFGVVAALKKGSIGLLLFASIMLFYWYYGKKAIAKKRAIHSYEQSTFKDKMIHIQADEKGLKIHSNGSDAQWAWEEITGVASLDDGVVIYREPHAHYIPAGAFSSIEEKSLFKTLAKKHGKLKV